MNDLLSAVIQISQELSLAEEKEKLLSKLTSRHISIFKKNNAFIAGGAVTSIFSNKAIVDYDIFFRTEADLVNCKNQMSESMFSSTPNAMTYKTNEGLIIQLIKLNFYPNPEDIFNDFDFTINCGLFDFQSSCFKLHTDFLKHVSQRKLVFNSTHQYPISSLIRSQKYKNRGYTLDQTNFFKIVMKIAALEIKTNKDAAEQVQGMYFGDEKPKHKELLNDNSPFDLDTFLSVTSNVSEHPSFGTLEDESLPF